MPFVIDVDRIAPGRGAAWLLWLARQPVRRPSVRGASMNAILLMTREGDIDAGLRRYQASLDASGNVGDNTPRGYPSTNTRIAR